MPRQLNHTEKNALCSSGEFRDLCIKAAIKVSASIRKVRVEPVVIRKLRGMMVLSEQTFETLPKALEVIFATAAQRMVASGAGHMINEKELHSWLFPAATVPAVVDSDDEAEWEPTGSLASAPTYQVRKILDRFKRDGKWYYLVDWQPTEEPSKNLTQTLIAAFKKERRALVRRTYIEDEAVEE